MIHDFSSTNDNSTANSSELNLKNSGIASGNSSLTKSVPFNRAAPPAGVPPLKLAPLTSKLKIAVGGAKIVPIAEDGAEGEDNELNQGVDNKEPAVKPRPPDTGVPLSALGHNPDLSTLHYSIL